MISLLASIEVNKTDICIPVTTSDNLRIRARAVCELEEARHLTNSGPAGAIRQEVVSKGGVIVTADPLDPDVLAAKLIFQATGNVWPERTLQNIRIA